MICRLVSRDWTDELTAVCIKPVLLLSHFVLHHNVERPGAKIEP